MSAALVCPGALPAPLIRRFSAACAVLLAAWLLWAPDANAQLQKQEYQLGAGDVVKITIFQNPDLTTETRIGETGSITFPLIGDVKVGGQTTAAAERLIAQRLKDGGFVQQAQVNLIVLQFKGVQVSVLGQVNKPGRYPVEGAVHKVTDMLALAGGVTTLGSDTITLVTSRSGREERIEIDLPGMFNAGDLRKDVAVSNGDLIYVPRAPVFYIYGEAQRPGQVRLERDMTIMQGLAAGGGPTARGTERGIKLHRRDKDGKLEILKPKVTDLLQPDDVIYVQESLF
jgi:polysaccharide export outer membrane protein